MIKSGVTYYKLTQIYSGDVTKNCALTGSEIDKNFHFLRGYDIESARVDADEDAIILSRVNCDDIIVQGFKEYIEAKIGKSDVDPTGTYYDKETGILHLMINGKEYPIEGFYIPEDIFIGEGLKGNGSINDPIRLDGLYMPGFLKPAELCIDTTIGGTLPSTPLKGERYLTKEFTSPYGLLYNFAAIEAISDELKKNGSDWHVPSIEEWDEMLNAVELCEEDRNHARHNGNPYNGRYAGKFLKGNRDWNVGSDSKNYRDYGFNVLPAGIREGAQYAQFSKAAEFWSLSQDEFENIHVKKFHGNKSNVQHRLENIDNCYSLRLVRSPKRSFSEIELIEGKPVKCVRMPYITEDGKEGSNVWTSENIALDVFDKEKYPFAKAFKVADKEGRELADSISYYINEWNGIEWEKKIFAEGDIIILKEFSGSTFEEVTVSGDTLVRRTDILYNRIKDYVDEQIEIEREARIEGDEELGEAIRIEREERVQADNILEEKIETEREERESSDADIRNALAQEIKTREETDTYLRNRIATEESVRKNADDDLQRQINTEIEARHRDDIDINQDYTTYANGGTSLKTYGNEELYIKFDGNFGEIEFYIKPMDKKNIYYTWYYENDLEALDAEAIMGMPYKEMEIGEIVFDELMIPMAAEDPETEEEFEELKSQFDCVLLLAIPEEVYNGNYDIKDYLLSESIKEAFSLYRNVTLQGTPYVVLVQYDTNNAFLPVGMDTEVSKITFEVIN